MQNPLQTAIEAHQAGNFSDAARLYSDVLRADPRNFYALYLFGVLHTQSGKLDGALRLFDEALRLNPQFHEALHQRGNVLLNSGRLAEALVSYDRALGLKPEAAEVLNAKGVALSNLGRNEEALQCYGRALALKPDFAAVLNNYANTLLALQRHEEAIAYYDRALALQPSYPDAAHNRGAALLSLGRLADALAAFDHAAALAPDYADAHAHRALTLATLGRHEEALPGYARALELAPGDPDTIYNRANSLLALDRFAEALLGFDAVLAIRPESTGALINKAVVLSRLGRHAEALSFYDRALRLTPNDLGGLYNRANALSVMRRFEEAIADCEKLLAADPDYAYAGGILIHSKLNCCDWRNLDEVRENIARGLKAGKRVLNPQQNVAVSRDPEDQLRCARLWVERESPPSAHPLWRGERYRHDRIRVAYLSADFHAHATAYLMAGLFEEHDRERFEIHAVSFGPDDNSAIRTRLKSAIEHFHDIRQMDDDKAAAFLRANEIDIAVDLKGYTENARTGIFAFRPVPLQVNYLGFPGTMGADYIDYIIADRVLIPAGDERHYNEKIVRLPHTYQCNDAKRAIAATGSRAEAGLPEDGFVFCSFNANYKITPEMFDVWARLLNKIEGSVLWLLESNPIAARNLRMEAGRRGIAAARLIFAPHRPLAAHLARHRLADLALDCLPYNAHTTASDALWAGLPFLTCRGGTFAGRVGASLLQAAGLPELITESFAGYEERALRLAGDKQALAALRGKLLAHRDASPLFDTRGFCRDLETAYATMWERHRRGEAPASFAVPAG